MKRRIILAVLTFNLFIASAQQKNIPYVVLISFDGFRWDYVDRFDLPNFKAFIKEGVCAESLIPCFPSKTFPNHYSLITGLYPGHHGLVDNYFFDPSKKEIYSMRDRKTLTDASYYGGMPLWRLAKQQGIRTASYFWVGSELKDENLRPDYYFEYEQSVPFEDRVSQVISWLTLPENERPHLITLYFSSPDTESHTFGPFANETRQKVVSMDSLLGEFIHRIKDVKLSVNVIIVSDHGMKEIREETENYIFLDELVRTQEGSITVVNGGTQAHIYIDDEKKRDSVFNFMKNREKNFSIIRRRDFPQRWHYNNERSGDLLLLANQGKYIVTGDRQELAKKMVQGATFGAHGYDPDQVKDMHGIFYAAGPNIKSGIKIKSFQNIHIYPLVAAILGLTIPPVDGSLKVLQRVYKR